MPRRIPGNSGGTRVSRVVSGVPPVTQACGVVGESVTRLCSCARGFGGTPNPTRGTRVPPETQYTSTSTVACSTDFTTSSNLRSFVFDSLSFAA